MKSPKRADALRATAALAALLAASASCRTPGDEDDLPPVTEIDVPTPAEASELAAEEITEENVDEEYAKLLAELERE